jgi:divalent metal cation (Fe/Co/Zn/Cd) transporter
MAYQWALWLAFFTILYNLVEGSVATALGYAGESLALFGFGLDSFIELISGLGIVQMIWRLRRAPDSERGRPEKTALRITGTAFYLLVIGLVSTSLYHLFIGHRPETTRWGVVISSISIAIMGFLVWQKRRVGHQLNSEPLLADANCTMTCLYMSVILLISSGIYALWGWPYVDSLGTLALAFYAFREGRECFEKARSEKYCAC